MANEGEIDSSFDIQQSAFSIPYSVRLAARLIRTPDGGFSLERRLHRRVPASDFGWTPRTRLKDGPAVSLVDISRGGALIEIATSLRPGSRAILEIAGPSAGIDVPFEVLRCQIASLGSDLLYRGACVFAEPFQLAALDELARQAAPRHEPLPADTAWQKIVARYRDGVLLKGYTLDFHPAREQFSQWPAINAATADRVLVPLAKLKAVFFVRDFDGNADYIERKLVEASGSGRRVEVTFDDWEVISGRTLNYRPDGTGFFVMPDDPGSNNQRIFVVRAAIQRVRFP